MIFTHSERSYIIQRLLRLVVPPDFLFADELLFLAFKHPCGAEPLEGLGRAIGQVVEPGRAGTFVDHHLGPSLRIPVIKRRMNLTGREYRLNSDHPSHLIHGLRVEGFNVIFSTEKRAHGLNDAQARRLVLDEKDICTERHAGIMHCLNKTPCMLCAKPPVLVSLARQRLWLRTAKIKPQSGGMQQENALKPFFGDEYAPDREPAGIALLLRREGRIE